MPAAFDDVRGCEGTHGKKRIVLAMNVGHGNIAGDAFEGQCVGEQEFVLFSFEPDPRDTSMRFKTKTRE